MSLVVINTHPVQYLAPLYRILHSELAVPTTVIYGSDFSVAGYRDDEFGVDLAWDSDLLSGYESVFLSRLAQGGPTQKMNLRANGVAGILRKLTETRAILLHGYRYRFDLQAFWQARSTGHPLLFRAETTDHARERGLLKRTARDLFLRWFYGNFAQMLYIGQHSRWHYERLGVPTDHLTFSPYCVDDTHFETSEADRERFRPVTRATYQIPDERIVILFSGKISYRKGPDLLVEAAAALPEEVRSTLTLLFVGDGELTDSIAQNASAQGVQAVFAGFQNQSMLSSFYHAADLLVLPSRHGETWGLVVNEALHHGIPAIVSDAVGCAPDLIREGQTGTIFEVGSVPSLQQAIREVLPMLRQAETRQQCRAVAAQYSSRAAAQGIADAYHIVTTSSAARA